MKIKKILNNSAVVTTNKDGEEIVVIGKGIAFGKKTNDEIDQRKIYKIFTPFDSSQR
ncbi:CAT RNA binding domain-containing protein, partial [Lactobacillus crispatus]